MINTSLNTGKWPERRSGSIILIGMPGAGKSTVGPLLARRTGRLFLDCDALLTERQGRGLQEIVDADGYLGLRAIEERLLMEISARHHVIATGGSAVYSDKAMRHLKTLGYVVWLRLCLDELRRRIGDFAARGLVKRPEQTLADLYAERQPLYQRHADMMVDCAGLNPDEVVENIVRALSQD
ncbi:MAG: shikimate kinase [Desulfobulbaceae bacterium]|jgi:shikimate kinase|nr:shikimate kinase [Desulfobulbaceae bacterium]